MLNMYTNRLEQNLERVFIEGFICYRGKIVMASTNLTLILILFDYIYIFGMLRETVAN